MSDIERFRYEKCSPNSSPDYFNIIGNEVERIIRLFEFKVILRC